MIKKILKNMNSCNRFSRNLYDKGYSCLDIIKFIEQHKKNKEKHIFLVYFDIIRQSLEMINY